MKKLITTLTLGLILSGCNIVHKMDIEQGNVVTKEMVNKVRTGMTKSQVREIMGTPVLLNTFHDGRIDYVYTLQPGGGTRMEKRLTLTFTKNGILQNMQAQGL